MIHMVQLDQVLQPPGGSFVRGLNLVDLDRWDVDSGPTSPERRKDAVKNRSHESCCRCEMTRRSTQSSKLKTNRTVGKKDDYRDNNFDNKPQTEARPDAEIQKCGDWMLLLHVLVG